MNWGAIILFLILLGILAFGIGCMTKDWYDLTKKDVEKLKEDVDKIDKED